jgi:hypothetical protein
MDHEPDSTGMSFDLGWIPPLHYTALKCRIHPARVHAVTLLSALPHRDGVWDSVLAARVATKVIELEEGISITSGPNDSPLDKLPFGVEHDSPLAAQSSRFCDVAVEVQNSSNVTLTCKQRMCDGTLKAVVHCAFDGHHWHTQPFAQAHPTSP